MIDIIAVSTEVLSSNGFFVALPRSGPDALLFENSTALGFVIAYPTCADLLVGWSGDAEGMIRDYQFALRRAGAKAWNTYTILLANEAAEEYNVALVALEEDLSGTRKIARAGMATPLHVREALMPLLPIQSAPRLEAVDMQSEIRQRTTSVPPRAVDAFLSKSDDPLTLQVLEE